MPKTGSLRIRPANTGDCALILKFIQALADYEKLLHKVNATEADLLSSLFGEKPAAEVLIAEWRGEPAGFALYFSNYSTFLARSGIYLEDLFVHPDFRGLGIGRSLLAHLAQLTIERNGARLDWSVLDWNRTAIEIYRGIGAKAMAEWIPFRLEGDALEQLAGVHPETD